MNAAENPPVTFSLRGITRLRVTHPEMTPATTQLWGGVRAEFAVGPLAVEITGVLDAGQQIALRIEDMNVARALTRALGGTASALEYCLRPKFSAPTPRSDLSSRSRVEPAAVGNGPAGSGRGAESNLSAAVPRVPARSCVHAVATQDAGAASDGTGAAAGSLPLKGAQP